LNSLKNLIRNKLAIFLMASFICPPIFSQTKMEQMTTGDKSQDLPKLKVFEDDINIHSLGLGIGQAYMTGDFNSNGASDLSWDILYNYSASHSFDLLVDLHANSYNRDNHEVSLYGLAASLKGKFFHFDNFIPFALGGMGVYAPKITTSYSDGSSYESDRSIVFGLNFGAGLDLKLNRHFRVGALFQFHNPFDVQPDNGPAIEGAYYKLLFTTFYSF